MTPLESLQSNGFTLTHSSPCIITSWGKWFCGFKSESMHLAGYGDNEEASFEDAYKTFLNTKNNP